MTTPDAKTTEMMAKVQKLLDLAEHPNTGEDERTAALAKADAIMLRYQLEEEDIRAAAPATSAVPIVQPVTVSARWSPYRVHYDFILKDIARLARVRVVFHNPKIGDQSREASLIGFAAEVQYAQMVYLNAHLQFMSKLEPKWDPQRTFDENVKVLREAGWNWAKIAHANKDYSEPVSSKYITAYRRQCKADGTEPIGVGMNRFQAYKNSFANGFVFRLQERVEDLVNRQEGVKAEWERERTGRSAEVALRDRAAVVDEKVYEMYPWMRPPTEEEQEQARQRRAEMDQREAARRAKLTDKQRAAENEKEARANERAWRRYQRESGNNYDPTGRKAGRSAANEVDLQLGKKVSRPERRRLEG